MTNDDQDTARRVVAGHVDEFRILVERHQDSVFRFARGLLGHRQEAEDVTQEVFLAAFRNLAAFDPGRGKFSTWLLTIARNRAINSLKRRSRQSRSEPMCDPVDPHEEASGLETLEIRRQLNRALESLSLEQRTVFVLAEIEALSYAEIADVAGISLGTVKSRLHRAKQQMRAALEPYARNS